LQADAKDSLKKRLRQEMVRRKILTGASGVRSEEVRFVWLFVFFGAYHREIGREATARNTNPQQTCEPTTRKSVGKPASQMGWRRKRAGTDVTLRPQRQTFACETAKAPRTSAGML
jgi:hypothetical protein